MWRIICLIFAVDRGRLSAKIAKFGLKKQQNRHPSIVWCEVYFNIPNCLGVNHDCDEQTDGQTLQQQMTRFTTLHGQ